MANHETRDIPVKEIGELLDEVSTKVPKLLDGINQVMYSQDAGSKAGKAVGSFYKELLDSGLPPEVAIKLTEKYMFSLNDLISFMKVEK